MASPATPNRVGQVNASGDPRALFEKVFAGEVLTTFETSTILKPLTEHKTISSGRSASFPAIYRASAGYHVPGSELTGGTIEHNEVVVSVDDQLISDVFIANIDEAMNHYDVRSPYSTELGLALAYVYDKNVARNIARAARGSALFSADSGGSSVATASADSSATVLAGAIWDAKQAMEEKDVPVDQVPVQAVMKPAQWYLLAQDATLVMNRDVDGDGSYSKGSFSMIGGVNVSRSNNMPFINDSGTTTIPAEYRLDLSKTQALVFTSRAAATVQLIGLATEEIYDGRRQGTLMLGKIAVGHGPLINKCAYEIKIP